MNQVDKNAGIKKKYFSAFEVDAVFESRRKTRNLGEKKRRDHFNQLIFELAEIVSPHDDKIDKSSVLKASINRLECFKDDVAHSKEFELDVTWKPSFITNEEFSSLMLQSINGFLIVFSSCGELLYVSSNLAFLLGYTLDEFSTANLYSIISLDDQLHLKNLFFTGGSQCSENGETPLYFDCIFIRKDSESANKVFERVKVIGFIRTQEGLAVQYTNGSSAQRSNELLIFVGLIQFTNSNFYPEILLHDSIGTKFISHHNFEWKFLYLDENAPSLIGYSPYEILGTSGYNYYHIDDLESIVAFHKSLMEGDEGVSGYYRFLTKGQQWIWLETEAHVERRQAHSRIEFIVCIHTMVKHTQSTFNDVNEFTCSNQDTGSSNNTTSSTWTGLSTSLEDSSYSGGNISHPTNSEYCDGENISCPTSIAYYPNDHSSSSMESNTYKRNEMHPRFYQESGAVSNSSGAFSYPYENNGTGMMRSICVIDSSTVSRVGTSNDPYLEYKLQTKCTEWVKIVADWKEESTIVSKGLGIAQNSNQQNLDAHHLDDESVKDENRTVRHFASFSELNLSETGNLQNCQRLDDGGLP